MGGSKLPIIGDVKAGGDSFTFPSLPLALWDSSVILSWGGGGVLLCSKLQGPWRGQKQGKGSVANCLVAECSSGWLRKSVGGHT